MHALAVAPACEMLDDLEGRIRVMLHCWYAHAQNMRVVIAYDGLQATRSPSSVRSCREGA